MQTRSGRARCGDIELFYEDLGDPGTPPVLLIMGVGAQLPMCPDGFCAQLIIDGARYVVVDGMGHDLPEAVWRPVVEALTENLAVAR